MSWVVVSLSVNVPALVSAVVALVPVDMSVVRVRVTVDIEASNSHVSDVSDRSSVPSHVLKGIVSSVWSGDGGVVVVVPVVAVVLD